MPSPSSFFVGQKEEVERARNLMDEMPLVKEEPTEVTYNSMIYACSTRRGKEYLPCLSSRRDVDVFLA